MIRAIVVDMDGTFLTEEKTYDKAKFLQLYKKMVRQKIAFIVASGNQYWHLVDFFPEIKKEISFIAENGACIVTQEYKALEQPIELGMVRKILEILETEPVLADYRLVMSGEENAYIHEAAPVNYQKKAHKFYKRLKQVPDYHQVDDVIYKFALNFPKNKVVQCAATLDVLLGGEIRTLTSGHEAIDLIATSAGKGAGLRFIMDKLGLKKDEVAVFGDNLNDFDMFQEVKYSYAMMNGRKELKAIAYEVIGDNNSQAVLTKIETILQEQERRQKQNVRIV